MDRPLIEGKRYRLQSRPWDCSYLENIEDDTGPWLYDPNKTLESRIAELEGKLREVQEENSLSRRWMWLNHGHTGMYGDDGEMQCSQCLMKYGFWDWKRTSIKEMHDKIAEQALKEECGEVERLRGLLREGIAYVGCQRAWLHEGDWMHRNLDCCKWTERALKALEGKE